MEFKRLTIIFSACAILIIFASLFSNDASFGATADVFYSVGKNLEAKIDILNGEFKTIDDENLFYNGQKVYISIEWRAAGDIAETSGISLELPVNRDEKQIGFESPVFKNIDLSSDDAKVITNLDKTGAKISSSFIASAQNPIRKGAKGTILVPHNIFAQPGAPEQKIQIILTGDDGEKYTITKNVKTVPEGLLAYNFKLYDRTGKTETYSFENAKNIQTQLGFSYKCGSLGINEGDALLIRIGCEGAARLIPYAAESVDVKDSEGAVVGFLRFYDNISHDGAAYIRLEFNGTFKKNAGAAAITGNVRFMQRLDFDRGGAFTIPVSANKSRQFLNVTALHPAVLERRFASDQKKYVAVNESDIMNQTAEVKAEFVLKVNTQETSEGYIDRESVRIAKILTKNQHSDVSAFGIDAQTLKPITIGAEDYVGFDKTVFESMRGLTVKEFEEYAGKTNAIKFLADENGNATGFELNLGKLNEPKSNGEYLIMLHDGKTQRVPKDSKPFGYLVYYAEIPEPSAPVIDDASDTLIIEEPPDAAYSNVPEVAPQPSAEQPTAEQPFAEPEAQKSNPVTGDFSNYWRFALAASAIFAAYKIRIYYSQKNKALKKRRVYVRKAKINP